MITVIRRSTLVSMRRLLPTLTLAAATAFVLAGCAGAPQNSPPASSPLPSPTTVETTLAAPAEPIAVVASTNVWGDLAASVGGDAVTVTSIIDDPDKDPHEYEANGQNQLALSKAAVVIENGGGYDDFIDTMLKAAGNDTAVVLNAVDISGKTAEGDAELNEHVWYDFGTVVKVVDQIEATYAAIDPSQADAFAKNATALKGQIDELVQKQADLKSKYEGEGVAITEPVPLYMLEAIGLDNKTPAEFSEAIEEDTDVAPKVLQQTLALFTERKVKLLAYNEQTTGPQTEAVLQAAQENKIPVVPVTETLPSGKNYVTWMAANLAAIEAALAS